ncbi:peptidase M24 [Halobacteriales archaeon SW_5_70_135]|nr:MAG: peptidase M24 [Halobacteriales archaeon SW_5_70_135]
MSDGERSDATEEPDLSPLAERLAETGADGYLVYDDSEDSDQRYVSGFDAPDPFTTLFTRGGTHLLVSGLEYGRARSESRADTVRRNSQFDYREKAAEYGAREAKHRVLAEFLGRVDPGPDPDPDSGGASASTGAGDGDGDAGGGVDSVLVPEGFPLGTAEGLREQGVTVDVETEGVVGEIRATKTDREVAHVREAQRANEAALRAAEELLREANVENGRLHHDGETLTSERVKTVIETTLVEHGYALDDTIVACGADGADPHDRGGGPLAPDEPVVIDVFPRSKATKYHADMTRTFVVGEPTAEVRRRHEVTLEAMAAAYDVLDAGTAAGITGAAVHDAVCDVYEDAGYDTFRSNPQAETGFIHSTGHGVGLDVHESPSVSPDGGELRPGNVVTVEPGLYDPAHGGLRVEDLVVVREGGYENLTDYHTDLVLD